MRVHLDAAVGRGAPNRPIDVIQVQDLVNNNVRFIGTGALMEVNGFADDALIDAIETFQRKHPGIKAKRPDGRVSPGGNTLLRLEQCKNVHGDYRSRLPRGFESNQLAQPDIGRFAVLYMRQYPDPPLGAAESLGLIRLVKALVADADVTDLRWAAYMLATVKHECANTWQPIEEKGKGAGMDHGQPVAVKLEDGRSVQRVYYGRGYVQLTWKKGYANMDKALGLTGKDSLLLYPENALDPDVAYDVMSVGMREGLITGVGLSRYINGAKKSYFYARQIILSLDQAERIQKYAEAIEFLLRFCNGVPVATGP
jgi:hypothetical protein